MDLSLIKDLFMIFRIFVRYVCIVVREVIMVGDLNSWVIRLKLVRWFCIFGFRIGCGFEFLMGERFWLRIFMNFFRICLVVNIMFLRVIFFWGFGV